MIIVIVINVFVELLAYLSKYKNTRIFFKVAFIIIFFYTAFRYGFGRDYYNYLNNFNELYNYSVINTINFDSFRSEPAWVILTFLFKPIGFYGFIIVLTAFFCYTYYSFIKKYVVPKYYWFSVFVYAFSFNIMWIQLSAIRQALSIAIFLLSIKFLNEKRNPLKFLALILLAGLFHTSAFLLIPLVVFSFERVKKSNKIGIYIFAVFLILLIFGESLRSNLITITEFFTGNRYISRFNVETTVSTTLIGSVFWLTQLLIVLYYARFQSPNTKLLFYLNSFFFLTYVLSPLVWLSGRMGYYFAPFSIVVYPKIILYEKNNIVRYSIFAFLSLSIIYQLYSAFNNDWIYSGFSNYITILSQFM